MVSGKLLWTEVVTGANSLAASTDDKLLATAIGYEVQVRDAASGQVTRKWTTEVRLSALAFSPDGKTLLNEMFQRDRLTASRRHAHFDTDVPAASEQTIQPALTRHHLLSLRVAGRIG
ncbi:MAG: hypothetical protein NT013_18195 [Planctomycetia bacterium]|nr:hypothetical protein [Planctomycetia bacterium]